jgi:lysozyme family protein
VSVKTGVPVVVLATIHNRESDADFTTNLGQGDPLSAPSVNVPKGRPPLGPPPNDHFPVTWEYAAEDALHIDKLDAVANWTIARALYEQELYNGFGPRNHGINTGYLWAGSNQYTMGKYVKDGVWDPNQVDAQLGTAPVMHRMIELDLTLALAVSAVDAPPVPQPPPIGVGGGAHDTLWLQDALNKCGADPKLLVDGNYGRGTRAAVTAFQNQAGITADGLAGPQTFGVLETKLASLTA